MVILALLVTSCQPDLFEDNPTAQDQTKITITHTSLKRLSKSAPAIYDRSLSLALGSSRLTKSADDSVSLAIDTTSILITEGLDYKNYIFRVRPEADSPPNELKNLMLVKLKDSLTHQYLVTYQMLDSVTIDTTNVRIEGFFADDLRNYTPMKCGGTDTQMTWVEGHYVEVRCKLPGRHGIGAVDCQATGDEAAYVYWVAGQYDVKFIKQEPCDDLAGSNGNVGVINGSNTAPGGNNNDGDDGDVDDNTDQSDDSIKVGIVPNREFKNPDRPQFCDEIDARHNTEPFKSKLRELNQEVKFNQMQEEGFVEVDGITPMIPAIPDPINPSMVYYPMISGIRGGVHLHIDETLDPILNVVVPTIRTPSRQDIASFGDLLNFRNQEGNNVNEAYDKIVSSNGIYTLRFSGSNDDIPDLSVFIDPMDLDENGYPDLKDQYDLLTMTLPIDEAFVNFLFDQNIPNLEKIELYKTDRHTLKTVKLELSSSQQLIITPCD